MKVYVLYLYLNTKDFNTAAVKAYRLLMTLLLLAYSCTLFSQVSTPIFKSFQPVELGRSPQLQQSPLFQPQRLQSILPNDPYEQQNKQIRQQSAINAAQLQRSPNNYLPGEEREDREHLYKARSGIYQNYFNRLLQMSPDDFSITEAVYLTESAWYNDPPSFETFENKIKKYATAVKQLLQREGLNIKNNTAINYGVQTTIQKRQYLLR